MNRGSFRGGFLFLNFLLLLFVWPNEWEVGRGVSLHALVVFSFPLCVASGYFEIVLSSLDSINQ